jgi:hypothetical protein
MSNLQAQLANELTAKGYKVTTPENAYYWVQANVLKADKMDLREAQGFLKTGYEGAVAGAALGAGITAYNSNSSGAALGVGLAAGLIGMAADAMIEDVNYTMVTDLQISERSKAKVTLHLDLRRRLRARGGNSVRHGERRCLLPGVRQRS